MIDKRIFRNEEMMEGFRSLKVTDCFKNINSIPRS